MRHAGQVVTRTMLLENVWDYHFDPQTNVIDVHVSRLRAKIEKDFDSPILHTVRGAGYMLKAGLTSMSASPARHHADDGGEAVGALFSPFRSLRDAARLLHDSLSARMLTAQTQETINEEVPGLDRAYRRGGLPLLVRMIEQRSRQPGANLYLIADPNGRILAGNVESLEPGVLETDGWTEVPFSYQRYGEGAAERRRRAPGGGADRSARRATTPSRWSRVCPTR